MVAVAIDMPSNEALAKKLTSESGSSQNVTVGVRIRPLNQKEREADMLACFTASEDASCIEEISADGEHAKDWAVDYAFGDQCSNEFIFKTFGEPLCDNALLGYNTVLFMYGQTSSGKTFTLFGGGEIQGCVGHTLEYIYNKTVGSEDSEYIIKLSYAELYNEELRDLLSEEHNGNLKIFDDPMLGPIIQGITQEEFTSAERAKELLLEGENRRHFGVTNMNAHSSRSHVLVRLHIECRKIGHKPATPFRKSWGRDKPTNISTLNLVDLAGSERANKSGTSGQSLKEGSFINKSLLTLGTVISSLSDGKSTSHIPYRDSKLTRLLASALGGNSKTCLITCISPATGNLVESQSTLRFATRAKKIVNYAQRNQFEEAKSLATKFAQQKAELDELREKFETCKQLGFSVEGEEGETIKSRAVSSIKNLKIMKFFMMHTPKIVKALRRKNQTEIAKKIEKDMKLTLSGALNLTETLEDHHEIVQNFYEDDDHLMKVMKETLHYNSTDILFSKEENELDINENVEIDVDMITGGFADENVKTDVEIAWMSGEDTSTKLLQVNERLKAELQSCVNNESLLKKQLEMASTSGTESSEKINKLLVNERKLNDEIDRLTFEMEKASAAFKQRMEEKDRSIEELKEHNLAHGATIKSLHETLNSTKSELEETRTSLDRVRADLVDSDTLRKSFEETLHKTRNDMRAQNDKLRNNMKLMMQEGGNEAMILGQQNSELQQQNNRLQDEMEITKQISVKLGNEIQILRSDFQRAQDYLKESQEEILKLSDDVSTLQQQLEESHMENSGLSGKSLALETEITELNRRINAETLRHEQSMAEATSEFESKLRSKESEIQNLSCQINELKEEIINEKNTAETRNLTHIQNIQSKNEEIARLERALNETIKHHGKLDEQNKVALSKANATIAHVTEERDRLSAELDIAQCNSINRIDESKIVKEIPAPENSEKPFGDHKTRSDLHNNQEGENTLYSGNNNKDWTTNDAFAEEDKPDDMESNSNFVAEALLEEYFEKKNAHMKEVEYQERIKTSKDATSDARYAGLRDAMDVATASLRFVNREEKSILNYLKGEANKRVQDMELQSNKISSLETLISSYSEAQKKAKTINDEETEKVFMLQAQVDELKAILHESKIEIKQVVASDQAKYDKILELNKDMENLELFVTDSKAEVELAREEVKEVKKEKEALLEKLKTAEKNIETLELRYDRLYKQATVIEKERADIVAQVINNTDDAARYLSSVPAHLPLS